MIRFVRLATLAALAVVLAPATPVLAQGELVNPPDPYVHKVAGIEFPAEAGPYLRGRVYEYDPDGSDASVGYSPAERRGEMTLYVYPARELSCREEFEGAIKAIQQHPGAKELEDVPQLRILRFAEATEYSVRYAIPAGSYGFDHPELLSDLWVGCEPTGRWLVKYRGSFPANDEECVAGLAEQLFEAIDWTPLFQTQ